MTTSHPQRCEDIKELSESALMRFREDFKNNQFISRYLRNGVKTYEAYLWFGGKYP